MDPSEFPVQQHRARCAVFRLFDRAALQDVLVLEPDEVDAVWVLLDATSLPLASHFYELSAVVQRPWLMLLRQIAPSDELILHTNAFRHFLNRLQHTATAIERTPLIAACMHHIRAHNSLNLGYMRWEELAALIEELRAVAPDLPPDDRLTLALFDAYKEWRHHAYDRCDAIITTVLQAEKLSLWVHADALMTRGLSAMNQGHLEAAQEDFRQARLLADRVGHHAVQGRSLVNQAWIYNQLAQYQLALECAQQALGYFEQADDPYAAAFARYTVANNAIYLGKWDIGREYLDQAATVFTTAGMDARVAAVEWARGFLHQLLGNEALSEEAYQRVLQITSAPKTSNLVTTVDTLTELGLLFHMQERWDEAADAYQRAIEGAQQLGDKLRQGLLLYRYSLLQRNRGDDDGALPSLEQAIACLEQVRASTNTEDMKIRILGTAQQVYESMVVLQLDRGDTTAAFAYVERARARAFLDVLARQKGNDEIALLQKYHYDPVTLAQLQASLDPHALLLEYYTMGVVQSLEGFLPFIPPNNKRLRTYLHTAPRIVLFAVTAEQCNVYSIAFDPNRLVPTANDPTPGWHLMTNAKLRWLYKVLVQPAESLLDEASLLHIIPHGPLHYVPFAALQRPDGNYLLSDGGSHLTYAPSATLFTVCGARSPKGIHQQLSIGYNGEATTRLLLAEHEALQIASLSEGGEALIAPTTIQLARLQQASDIHHLHIASHAIFDAVDPLASALLISPDDQLDARTIMRTVNVQGALVTLNACTSGLSHVASGDELLGLPRAFLYAGAAHIICTLREVDDLAAYVLMVFLREDLTVGSQTHRALHQAQLRLRSLTYDQVAQFIYQWVAVDLHEELLRRLRGMKQQSGHNYPYSDPEYWASFMLVGKP